VTREEHNRQRDRVRQSAQMSPSKQERRNSYAVKPAPRPIPGTDGRRHV
jgi:hypothetical protein